jgi:hypothetical protein
MVAYEIQKIEETYSDIPWLIIGREAERYTDLIKSSNKQIVQVWPVTEPKGVLKWVNSVTGL